MTISIQQHLIFLICFILYFTSSDHGSCHGREDQYLREIISLLDENEEFSTQINTTTNSTIFNVVKYGAKGDGATNDAESFVKTWSEACKVNGGVMLVPSGFTFLLQEVNFEGGPCKPNIVVQVDGKLVAPAKAKWINKTADEWIQFQNNTKGLTIKGHGVIDGQGGSWWADEESKEHRPHAVLIRNGQNVTVTGITIQNSPRMHIFFENSQHLRIYNFTTSSPADSPNTDGIHFTSSQHIDVHDCTLACGDDCVSIQSGCSDVRINNVRCGPGHGYSIGGLGPNSSRAEVSDVSVLNSKVQNALNGVRIKTWPGGSGYVQNVTFSNIEIIDVKNPIVIDQHYCGGSDCHLVETSAVAVSKVTFEKITGTFTSRSVLLDCSIKAPCKNLTISGINLTLSSTAEKSKGMPPLCSNAYGVLLTKTTPPLESCLGSHHEAPAPSPAKSPKLDFDPAPSPAKSPKLDFD